MIKSTSCVSTIILTIATIIFSSCGNDVSTTEGNENSTSESGTELDSDSASYFEDAIFANATSPLPYWDRAGWHLRNGRINQGLNDLDLAIKADSTYGPAWSAKSDALYFLREFESCIEHLDVCLKYAPNHIPCKLRRAEMHIHLNQYKEAFELLNDALRIDDQLHEAYWMKGVIYRKSGELDNAISSFQTSIEVNPEFFDGYISLGLAYADSSSYLAVDYYNSAISLRPNSVEAKYNLAMYYQELKLDDENASAISYNKALSLYAEILDIDSLNASAAFNSGFIYLEYFQNYTNADLWFTEAIIRLPYYHQAFFNRGLARESLDLKTEALADYNAALKIKPDYNAAAIAKSRVLKNIK